MGPEVRGRVERHGHGTAASSIRSRTQEEPGEEGSDHEIGRRPGVEPTGFEHGVEGEELLLEAFRTDGREQSPGKGSGLGPERFGDVLRLRWTTMPGRRYAVFWAGGLPASWNALPESLLTAGVFQLEMSFDAPISSGGAARLFRVGLLPGP